ncbi:MAG: ABC transporter permease [Bacteroidales bacterium]|nr:ABC transporter permease [Bacteroidales bacterium]
MKNKSLFNWIVMILSAIVLLFIIAPLFKLLIGSIWTSWQPLSNDIEVWDSIRRTLIVAFITTLIFSVGAIPLAYLLAKREFIFKKLIISIIDIPLVIPHSAAGIALLTIWSENSFISHGIQIVDNWLGISLAMAFVSLPLLIQSAREGFSQISENIEKSALSLGASPTKVFLRISLPLAWKHIVTGFIMMFARGMSEFGAVVVIAYYPMTSSVLLFERMNQFGLSYVQPIAAVIVLISLIVFIILRILAHKIK